MRVKRETKPILHRQKCAACNYYTLYQALPAGDQATDTCTHCGHQVTLAWDDGIKAAIKNTERMLKDLEEIYPELKALKAPGDHIRLE
ncbi:hypothetical protein [Geoalkalibacter halelectricus]|uniref:Uncharacterized protein n=1 Tax=Geoalkalibacter halelectricus TaxID=2847045 RepID=A0ABY5ZNF6_9BACT|nr:hypothetical protein [Geoalkalibacter halelectricus]MDO3378970.1 hypothetical protein [Geoalkalibacter halelectricus]UWZ78786.1 hypothetical protein L9S41_14010 [Geoalkalibacter halelectricus]